MTEETAPAKLEAIEMAEMTKKTMVLGGCTSNIESAAFLRSSYDGSGQTG